MRKDQILDAAKVTDIKVTHRSFMAHEYFYYDDKNKLRTEDGFVVDDKYWKDKDNEYWNEGWSVWGDDHID